MSRRLERVNGLLRQEISSLLTYDLKDPRISTLVTITSVDASVDLRYATVYASVMGTQEQKQTVLQVLNFASGFFRRELRQRLSFRTIPQLSFVLDDSIERGTQLLGVINQLSQEGDSSS